KDRNRAVDRLNYVTNHRNVFFRPAANMHYEGGWESARRVLGNEHLRRIDVENVRDPLIHEVDALYYTDNLSRRSVRIGHHVPQNVRCPQRQLRERVVDDDDLRVGANFRIRKIAPVANLAAGCREVIRHDREEVARRARLGAMPIYRKWPAEEPSCV